MTSHNTPKNSSPNSSKDIPKDTPMMRQYHQIKQQHQGSVLFFRMGDFYEMFYADAEEVSRLLNLTLTKRQGIPMCGIPYHAVQNYLARLLQLGRRVAICEQTELPAKAGVGISKREVVEIVSPGTAMQDGFLDGGSNNYLQAFGRQGAALGMALLDLSTGEFTAASFCAASRELRSEVLLRELLLASSRELLLMEELHDEFPAEFWGQQEPSRPTAGEASAGGRLCNRIPSWCFAPESAERKLLEFFGLQSLKGFGFTEGTEDWGAAFGAAWVILEYLQQNQYQTAVLAHVQRLLPLRRQQQLQLDCAALRNLEVFGNLASGSRDYTLFQVLHDCQSAMGSRCLHRWLREPLLDRQQLQRRYQRVAALQADGALRSRQRQQLGQLSDLERIVARIASTKANARDLVALRSSLQLYQHIYQDLQRSAAGAQLVPLFALLPDSVGGVEPPPAAERAAAGPAAGNALLLGLQQLLQRSVAENPPAVLHEGGLIAAGYSAQLDELRTLGRDSRRILDDYVAREQRRASGVKLKLKYNKIIGHYFEISKAQAQQAVLPSHFICRQSLVNAQRYSTTELGELESKLSSAEEQITGLERQLFEQLCVQVRPYVALVLALAQALAELDVLANFAEISLRHDYVRPELLEQGQGLYIEAGRHPVVEYYLRDEDFVPNDLQLDRQRFFALITGPNMAGKSTYLRQNALIVLLAQIGCFVPARKARLAVVDRIFCRVGASDNLSRGESTFMVEMQETARILHQASAHSLVIMDEVGRGTSSRDGLAIAQSICEYILGQIGCWTLFATHYHELTNLSDQHLQLLCLAVEEVPDEEAGQAIRFLKHVQQGAIASSYGVHVAALAGIPQLVTVRAAEILQQAAKQAADWAEPPDQAVALRSQQARKASLLFSDADFLLAELQELQGRNLKPEPAQQILQDWLRKYGR